MEEYIYPWKNTPTHTSNIKVMKQLLLILSLLLTCTAAQAQRYRLLADSTFAYNEDSSRYELNEFVTYRYNDGNEWMTSDGKNFHYDTAYRYRVEFDSLSLLYKQARIYDNGGKLLKEVWYEQYEIGYKRDSAYGVLMITGLLYYNDGAYVPVRVDSFAYDLCGRVIGYYMYTVLSERPRSVPNRLCKANVNGNYDFYLREVKRYQYDGSDTLSVDAYEYWSPDYLKDESHSTYRYKSGGRKKIIQTSSIDGVSTELHVLMDRAGIIKETNSYHTKVDDSSRVLEKCIQVTKCKKVDGTYTCTTLQYEKGKGKKLIGEYVYYYNADGVLVKNVYKEYLFNGRRQDQTMLLYKYTPYGYLNERASIFESMIDNRMDRKYGYKTTYTYEQY